MTNFRKTAVFGALLLFGAGACADLDVTNPNEADRGKAIRTPLDVQSLVSGSFSQWFSANHHASNTPSLLLSAQAFQHSSSAANFGMLSYPALPRFAAQNTVTHQDYVNLASSWNGHYRALAAIADGLRAINNDTVVRAGLGTDNVRRVRAFGKFVQGLSHASIAVLYDRGFRVDETVTTIDENGQAVLLGEPLTSAAMMTAAIGYLDQAIAAAQGGPAFTIPAAWMSVDVPSATLVRLANSFKAQFRAANARTAAQRTGLNWTQIKADIDAGLTGTFNLNQTYVYNNWLGTQYNGLYIALPTFTSTNYMVHGMADQSGRYQNWLARSIPERHPNQAGASGAARTFLIVTPDRRFVRGDTVLGTQTGIAGADSMLVYRNQACGSTVNCSIARPAATPTATRTLDTVAVNNAGREIYYGGSSLWSQPGRGTWRWSYYIPRAVVENYPLATVPLISKPEMDLLKAEAHFRLGETAQAVTIINTYRVAAGLNATNDAGLNTSCVPKLPNGTCGNLFEMLKWEKRLETFLMGPYAAGWFFDSRGWGDLYEGTQLEFPIPEQEYVILGLGAPYTFGGPGGQSSAPESNYHYPFE